MSIGQWFARVKARVSAWFTKDKLRPEPQKKFEYEPHAPKVEPDRMRPTKAYADERQKARRNRRRKPKKALANLYRLA